MPPSPQQGQRFNFDAAVYIIRQAPLINWMQTFPTEDMKSDHVDGYCICKVLVQNSPVLHLQDHAIRPTRSIFEGCASIGPQRFFLHYGSEAASQPVLSDVAWYHLPQASPSPCQGRVDGQIAATH